MNTNAYEPSVHDAFFTSCATYLQASSPSAYGTLSSFYSGHLPSAPCGSAGNVASATTTDSSSATDLLSVASSARVSLMTATQTSAANSQAMYATPSFFSTPTPGEPFVPTPGTATTTPGELTGAEASAGAGPTTATAQQLTRSKGVGARSPDVVRQQSSLEAAFCVTGLAHRDTGSSGQHICRIVGPSRDAVTSKWM